MEKNLKNFITTKTEVVVKTAKFNLEEEVHHQKLLKSGISFDCFSPE